eukprot:jgi/Ulvmu1/12555/UM090_0042.1
MARDHEYMARDCLPSDHTPGSCLWRVGLLLVVAVDDRWWWLWTTGIPFNVANWHLQGGTVRIPCPWKAVAHGSAATLTGVHGPGTSDTAAEANGQVEHATGPLCGNCRPGGTGGYMGHHSGAAQATGRRRRPTSAPTRPHVQQPALRRAAALAMARGITSKQPLPGHGHGTTGASALLWRQEPSGHTGFTNKAQGGSTHAKTCFTMSTNRVQYPDIDVTAYRY